MSASRTVQIAGGHRVTVREEGRGPVVLFLHAFPLSSDMWEREIGAVASAGRRAVAMDFPGFGASPGPARPGEVTTMEGLAEDALGLLDVLGVARASIVCCSMGGYVVFPLCARAPGRVAGLVLESTRFGADSDEARRGRHATAAKVEAEGLEVLIHEMLPRLVAPGPDPAVLARAAEIVRTGSAFGAAAALRGMAARADHRVTCEGLHVPVLVVGGALDPVTTPAEVASLAAAIPGARRVEIPAVGHLANLEAPDAFAAAMLSFLASLPA